MKVRILASILCACFLFSHVYAVRFLATSDTHSGATKVSDMQHSSMKLAQIPQMLELVRSADPPAALIIAGDLTQGGKRDQIVQFRNEWEFPFLEELGLQMYVCHGNHDAKGRPMLCGNTPAMRHVIDRHDNLNYSFEINGLHFLCCGLHPGEWSCSLCSMCPSGSLQWLRYELANIGKSQPIVIFFHYNIVGSFSDWWYKAKTNKDAFFNAIQDYNVKLIITGHKHETFSHLWRGEVPTICVGGTEFAACDYDEENGSMTVVFCNANGELVAASDREQPDYTEGG